MADPVSVFHGLFDFDLEERLKKYIWVIFMCFRKYSDSANIDDVTNSGILLNDNSNSYSYEKKKNCLFEMALK